MIKINVAQSALLTKFHCAMSHQMSSKASQSQLDCYYFKSQKTIPNQFIPVIDDDTFMRILNISYLKKKTTRQSIHIIILVDRFWQNFKFCYSSRSMLPNSRFLQETIVTFAHVLWRQRIGNDSTFFVLLCLIGSNEPRVLRWIVGSRCRPRRRSQGRWMHTRMCSPGVMRHLKH